MIKQEPNITMSFAEIMRTRREFSEFIYAWYREETDRLPVTFHNVAVAQGRCQVLKELYDALSKAPEIVADPAWRQRATQTVKGA